MDSLLEVTEYCSPNGRKVERFFEINSDFIDMVEDNKIQLSLERLVTGDYAVYGFITDKDDEEIVKICDTCDIQKTLKKIITILSKL